MIVGYGLKVCLGIEKLGSLAERYFHCSIVVMFCQER